MEPRLQRRVQRYGWDRAAGVYEALWGEQLRPAQDALLEMARLRPGERVLDVACGTGLVTFPAAERVGATGRVLATDISEAMVAGLAAEAARRGIATVETRRMGAEEIDCPDAAFDAALCALGLMYVPEPDRAAREMARVARPGGRVVVAVWGSRRNCGWADIFPIVDARVQSEVCPMFFQLGTGDALALLLAGAGLADVEAVRIPTVLRYATAEAAAAAAFAGGPVALAYSRFDPATRDAAHAEYLASIEPWRRSSGYEIPGEFVVACGVRP